MNPLSQLRDEACNEGYEYFDSNIRPLAKLPSGKVDPTAHGLENNDVDAFRHAYVSGVFTQKYGESVADLLGRLNELHPAALYSNSINPRSKNMDLWNNNIGRKYSKKAKNREDLLKMIHEALKNGELICDPSDTRNYEGAQNNPINTSRPIMVLVEDQTGRNQFFFDMVKRKILTLDEFIALIQKGNYPGYTIKMVNGISTPVSMPDGKKENNLT